MSDSAQSLEELSELIPQGHEIEIDGEKLQVTPLRIRQLVSVMRPMARLWRHFGGPANEIDILGLITDGGEDLVAAVAAAIDRPAEWVGDLALDEFTRLVRTVIEVNADFFVRAVLPEVQKLNTNIESAGKMFSSI